MADHDDSKIQQFCAMTGTNPEQASEYLEAHGWDLTAACESFFADADEEIDQQNQGAAPAVSDNYTGPRTLDGRPAPHTAASSGRADKKPAGQQKKKGIATLGSITSSNQHDDHDDDDDDDFDEDEDSRNRGNLFAGGEKSGLAVQDPKQDGGPKKIISDILAKARANAARHGPEDAESSDPARQSRFRGTGMTLGGEGVESRAIPDPLGPVSAQSSAEPQERVLHIWNDGFSIDDGELRRFDDPANQADLNMIRSGRAPLHLMNVNHDQPVDVKLFQHHAPYTPPPKKYKAFSGAGRRLGSPVPGDGNEASAFASASGSSSLNAMVAPSAQGTQASAPQGPTVDESRPTITLRIQLPDGTRLPARFNTTHTIADVYGFIQGASTETRSRPWVLVTTFPNKEHADRSLVLGEMPEFKKGGTAVVKWA